MENTNKKKKNILAIILGVILVAVTTFGVLLYTGVVKSPMVKEKECKETKCDTKTTDDTKKTDTKVDTKTDTKTDTTTEKTADERYKEYVTGLADSIKNNYYTKSTNSGTSFSSKSYSTVYGNYRLSIDKDLKLIYAKDSDSTAVANNVVAYFRVHTGNGIPSTVYCITSDAKLYSVDFENAMDLNKNYEIKELNIKNVVDVVPGSFDGDGGQRAIFIDIDGNVITE